MSVGELVDVKIGGIYITKKKIGNGAFSEIYLGINTETDQEVAIKFVLYLRIGYRK